MKKKNNKPNLTQPVLDIHKMLQAIYRKGYLAGKRDALKKWKENQYLNPLIKEYLNDMQKNKDKGLEKETKQKEKWAITILPTTKEK